MVKYSIVGKIREFTPRDLLFLHPRERQDLADAAVEAMEGSDTTRASSSQTVNLFEERARMRRGAVDADWNGSSKYGFAPWYDMPDLSNLRNY